MKNLKSYNYKNNNPIDRLLKTIFLFIFITIGMIGIKAQNSFEASFDIGVSLPYKKANNLNFTRSNSPYKYGYNGSFEVSYHWQKIGIGIQTSYFNINDQEFTLTQDIGSWKATNFRGKKSRITTLFLPFYYHVYNKNNLRISPTIGLGLAWFRKSAFTWRIEQFSTIIESEVKLETSSLFAAKVGIDIIQRLNEQLAIKYGVHSNYLTGLFGNDMFLSDLSLGVILFLHQNVPYK